MMQTLTWDDFADSAGATYELEAGERKLELVLERVEQIPSAARAGGSFRLEFLGPCDPVLPQAIYPFRQGRTEFDIFIVPIGRDASGTRYEAVFN